MSKRKAREERLLNPDGRRHHRKTYSLTELRIGLVIIACLVAVAAWVAWRGAHPDPSLVGEGVELLLSSGAPADRGPVPDALAAEGWREGRLSVFDSTNLYEKINGREDFYKSFGFELLYFIPLVAVGDETTTVDIELYDLGRPANALGCYAGERQPGSEPQLSDAGMSHRSRNSFFLTRGRFYVRAIGSSESAAVLTQLDHLRTALQALPGDPLPWGYALLLGQLKVDPAKIRFAAENAFSFGFARNVYSATVGPEETELYVTATSSAVQARTLAAQFQSGLGGIGEPVAQTGWLKHRYLGEIAGARAEQAWVIGVRQAPDVAAADAALATIQAAVRAAPAELLARAQSENASDTAAEPEGADTPEASPPGGAEPPSVDTEPPGGAKPPSADTEPPGGAEGGAADYDTGVVEE